MHSLKRCKHLWRRIFKYKKGDVWKGERLDLLPFDKYIDELITNLQNEAINGHVSYYGKQQLKLIKIHTVLSNNEFVVLATSKIDR